MGIDPNMGDLLYCVSGISRSQAKFRYMQDQRRSELKIKKYRLIQQQFKNKKADGQSVQYWETQLSSYDRKTLDFTKFQDYCKMKNQLNACLASFYGIYLFCKLRLGSYMLKQQTESRLLNNFKKAFGGPETHAIAFGDWEQRAHQKYKEPTKGKGFRDLFRKAGYQVYLVDK